MKKLLMCAVVLMFVATGAQAGVGKALLPSSLATGAFLTTQTSGGDGTAGLLATGFYQVLPKLVAEFGYESSGEGADEAMTRLGAHYEILTDPLDRAGLSLGGGIALRGFGVQDTEVGGYGSLAMNIHQNTAIAWRAGVDVNANFSRQPKPSVTLKMAAVMPLPF